MILFDKIMSILMESERCVIFYIVFNKVFLIRLQLDLQSFRYTSYNNWYLIIKQKSVRLKVKYMYR